MRRVYLWKSSEQYSVVTYQENKNTFWQEYETIESACVGIIGQIDKGMTLENLITDASIYREQNDIFEISRLIGYLFGGTYLLPPPKKEENGAIGKNSG